MSVGRVINGSLAVRNGKLACSCCGDDGGGGPPPWRPPGGPPDGGPDGPDGPTDPNADPNCCNLFGATCTTLGDDLVYLGSYITGSYTSRYSYANGPIAGEIKTSQGEWGFWETEQENTCTASTNRQVDFPVSYIGEDGSEATKTGNVRVTNLSWRYDRAFYGAFPLNSLVYSIDNLPPGPADRVTWRLVRRSNTGVPIILAEDQIVYDRNANIIEEFSPGSTHPTGTCRNLLVGEFQYTFVNGSLGSTVSDAVEHDILMRVYAYAARVVPCPTELIV